MTTVKKKAPFDLALEILATLPVEPAHVSRRQLKVDWASRLGKQGLINVWNKLKRRRIKVVLKNHIDDGPVASIARESAETAEALVEEYWKASGQSTRLIRRRPPRLRLTSRPNPP
ncbi:MAG: hypothetical protein ACYTAF_11030 [Planctomycetota bacterium]|jgi:hypothetical protein